MNQMPLGMSVTGSPAAGAAGTPGLGLPLRQSPVNFAPPNPSAGVAANPAASPSLPQPPPPQAPMAAPNGGLTQVSSPVQSSNPAGDVSASVGGPGAMGMAANMMKAAGDKLQSRIGASTDPYNMVFGHGMPGMQQQPAAISPIQMPSLNSMVNTSDRRSKRGVRQAKSETAQFLADVFRSMQ